MKSKRGIDPEIEIRGPNRLRVVIRQRMHHEGSNHARSSTRTRSIIAEHSGVSGYHEQVRMGQDASKHIFGNRDQRGRAAFIVTNRQRATIKDLLVITSQGLRDIFIAK